MQILLRNRVLFIPLLALAMFGVGCGSAAPIVTGSTDYVGGIFALGPVEGDTGYVNEALWKDPAINGAFIRLPWDEVQTGPGTEVRNFDFSRLDHELNAAVAHGKHVSIAFSAGKDGTPEWLFTKAGVKGYDFQDGGSQLEEGKCGAKMKLGNPTDPAYQEAYFSLIQKVGEHIRTRQDWFDAVAYVKISGANLYTFEFRLPNRCEPGCVCNSQVWSEAGYTPEGMYAFFTEQMEVWQEALPGKPMVYALIQDGLPDSNAQGDYELENGASSGGELIKSTEQVNELIKRGSDLYGPLFVVSHNGLGPDHEPNRWVTRAGKAGQPTLFQTMNLTKVQNTADLQATLENLWNNTDAHYLEVYQQILLEAEAQDGRLVPDADAEVNTLQEWNDELQSRAP